MNNLQQDIFNVFNGQTPIRRQNRKPGESQYYYINPNQGNVPFSELKTTDIPDGQSLSNTGQGVNQNQQAPTLQPTIWESAAEGKQVYDNVVKQEGNFTPPDQNMFSYDLAVFKSIPNMVNNYLNLNKMKLTDKYKHAYMNCQASQFGKGGSDVASIVSDLREINDIRTGANTLDSSAGDQYANKIGRLLGGKYPDGDCDELIQKYIKKKY